MMTDMGVSFCFPAQTDQDKYGQVQGAPVVPEEARDHYQSGSQGWGGYWVEVFKMVDGGNMTGS